MAVNSIFNIQSKDPVDCGWCNRMLFKFFSSYQLTSNDQQHESKTPNTACFYAWVYFTLIFKLGNSGGPNCELERSEDPRRDLIHKSFYLQGKRGCLHDQNPANGLDQLRKWGKKGGLRINMQSPPSCQVFCKLCTDFFKKKTILEEFYL